MGQDTVGGAGRAPSGARGRPCAWARAPSGGAAPGPRVARAHSRPDMDQSVARRPRIEWPRFDIRRRRQGRPSSGRALA